MRAARNPNTRLLCALTLATFTAASLLPTFSSVSASVSSAAIAHSGPEDRAGDEAGSRQRGPSCSERCERRTGHGRASTTYEHLAEEVAARTHAGMLEALARLAAHLSHRRSAPLRVGDDFDLTRPVAGKVGSPFGPRRHPILNEVRPHRGVDLSAPSGTPVRAAGPGRVVRTGHADAYGILVTIDHGDGAETRYAHLSRALVQPGEIVARGQDIGEVGSTGLSTGPHLHFELRVDGTAIDPAPWLPPEP